MTLQDYINQNDPQKMRQWEVKLQADEVHISYLGKELASVMIKHYWYTYLTSINDNWLLFVADNDGNQKRNRPSCFSLDFNIF